MSNGSNPNPGKDLENGTGIGQVEKAKAGTANFLIELESRRAIKVFGKSTLIGLAICFFAGICFSLFSPIFNLATNDQWHTLDDGVPHLSVYTAFFYFSCSHFPRLVLSDLRYSWLQYGMGASVFAATGSSNWVLVNNGISWILVVLILPGLVMVCWKYRLPAIQLQQKERSSHSGHINYVTSGASFSSSICLQKEKEMAAYDYKIGLDSGMEALLRRQGLFGTLDEQVTGLQYGWPSCSNH